MLEDVIWNLAASPKSPIRITTTHWFDSDPTYNEKLTKARTHVGFCLQIMLLYTKWKENIVSVAIVLTVWLSMQFNTKLLRTISHGLHVDSSRHYNISFEKYSNKSFRWQAGIISRPICWPLVVEIYFCHITLLPGFLSTADPMRIGEVTHRRNWAL